MKIDVFFFKERKIICKKKKKIRNNISSCGIASIVRFILRMYGVERPITKIKKKLNTKNM